MDVIAASPSSCVGLQAAKPPVDLMVPHRDQVSWSKLLWQYTKSGQNRQALKLYDKMRKNGVELSSHTFVAALKACTGLHDLKTARQVHAEVVVSGLESDVHVGTMLVDMYAKCGNIVEARRVFEKMPQRNVVSWTAMISGYAHMEEGEVALDLYAQMQQEGVLPNDRTFVSVLKACSHLGILEEGSKADGKHVKIQTLKQVRDIHLDVVRGKFESDLYVGTMLVDAYAKCGSLVDARQVFEKMPHRNVVSWTAMITGYAQMEEGDAVLQLYARMQQDGISPNDRTFVSALKACGCVSGLDKGKEIHARISELGLEATDPFVVSALVDMYGKCGSMIDAQLVFDAWPTRDIVTWNALIAGYARQGESERVFDSFGRMRQEGLQPNGVTLLGVLTVCSHVGLVDVGQNYFEAMSKAYGVTPAIDHYTCMLDLLGRAGHVEKALAIVKAMPFQPDSVVWNALLSSCRKWGKVNLAREAFDCAVRLNQHDARAYLLLANIYAAAHLEKDANEIHAMRRETGAWKQPGQSLWTDIGGTVHAFVVGDQDHPKSPEIYIKLQDLFVKIKGFIHVPHLDRDIPDDVDEDVWCGHSERLGMAYALLMRTTEGVP